MKLANACLFLSLLAGAALTEASLRGGSYDAAEKDREAAASSGIGAYSMAMDHKRSLAGVGASYPGQVTEEQKRAILDTHNDLRSQVALGKIEGQPMATNMHKIVWDDKLAEDVARWTATCPWDHDPNLFKGYGYPRGLVTENGSFSGKGQNVVWDVENSIRNGWFAEHDWWTYGVGEKATNKGSCKFGWQFCGHYVATISGRAISVGCGYAKNSDYCPKSVHRAYFFCRYEYREFFSKRPYWATSNANEVATECDEGFIGNKETGLCE